MSESLKKEIVYKLQKGIITEEDAAFIFANENSTVDEWLDFVNEFNEL